MHAQYSPEPPFPIEAFLVPSLSYGAVNQGPIGIRVFRVSLKPGVFLVPVFVFSYSTPRLLPRRCLLRHVSQNPDLVYTRKSRGGHSHGRRTSSTVDEPRHRAARLSNFLFRNKYLWRCFASECIRIGMPRGLTPKLVREIEQFEIVICR